MEQSLLGFESTRHTVHIHAEKALISTKFKKKYITKKDARKGIYRAIKSGQCASVSMLS